MAYQFTDEDRSKGGHASTAVQRQNRAERDRRSIVVHEIVSEMDDVSPAMLQAALSIAQQVTAHADELPMDSWLDAQRAATASEILHRIHRLASGQSTSNVARRDLSDDERRELLARLRGGDSDTTPAT